MYKRIYTEPETVLPITEGNVESQLSERCCLCGLVPAEWLASPARGRPSQPPGHRPAAASPRRLPAQPGLGKAGPGSHARGPCRAGPRSHPHWEWLFQERLEGFHVLLLFLPLRSRLLPTNQ